MRGFHIGASIAVFGVLLSACGNSGKGAPAAPELVIVKPMAGVVHVEWAAKAPCDLIKAERKDDRHPTFVPAFEVRGDKTSHMDAGAAANTTYTYRLQCQVGSALSGYSNEMSANPTVKSQ